MNAPTIRGMRHLGVLLTFMAFSLVDALRVTVWTPDLSQVVAYGEVRGGVMQLRAAGTYVGSVSVVVSLEPGEARPYPGLVSGYSGVLEKEKLSLNAASGRVTLSTLLERWNIPVQWLRPLPRADIWRNRAVVGRAEPSACSLGSTHLYTRFERRA
ncbi:hypothetical protein SAMN00790413_06272 [Deinococcus hopiensis KR-140]|uniref:Uncharacterized protein n=2 Tax=Deinococcus TaxID=1298 RepID=A0A1W1VUP9_9DEIO|nr:hypothetical protein SAMN00790413_06272 [Deinococcus hopiensis KR-140]